MTRTQPAKRVKAVVLVAMLAATVAVATWFAMGTGSATASMAPKHAPTRPFCTRTTKKKAVAAIRTTWDTLLNGKLTLTSDQRFAVVDGSDDPTLRATLDDLVAENSAMLKAATVRVGRVTCTAKTTADVDYVLQVDGSSSAGHTRTGTAVLMGRRWKASAATVCDLFASDDPSLAQRGPCAL